MGMVHVVMDNPAAFARFIPLPENHSALVAFQELARSLKAGETDLVANPLFLHGPTGVGKSCLIAALIEDACGQVPGLSASVLSANAFPLPWDKDETAAAAQRYREA